MVEAPSNINFLQVSFSYDKKEILNNITLSIPASKTTVLFGPSGSGKTTCLRLISGLEKCSKGEIKFNEKSIDSTHSFLAPAKRSVGFCFQDDALWPRVTVYNHLAAVLKSQSLSNNEITTQVQNTLQQFQLVELAQRYPNQLSGGEKKRLALARALVSHPQVLLLDEPLSSVEGPLREEMINHIWSIKSKAYTIILVTHTLSEALALADYLVLLNNGEIIQQGTVQDVFHHPKNLSIAQWLGYRNFFTCERNGNAIKTPIGFLDHKIEVPPHSLAAALPEDTEAEQDDSGDWTVQKCYFQGSHYRLLVEYDKIEWTTISKRACEAGQKVNLKWINPPKFISQSSHSI